MNGIVIVWRRVRKIKASAKKIKEHFNFTPMSVAHVDDNDDVHAPGEVYLVEKKFPNGDVYIGHWADGCPHGTGKYLWDDGCIYVGEWVKGKENGKGKFVWPSGAKYEGQFKRGYMDGEGIYACAADGNYRGAWLANMKHGKGSSRYPNGDRYKGEWRFGLPDGQGRYEWQNGNQYIGQWSNGKRNGRGTMMWDNGNRYDGNWEDDFPKGKGTFRWPEGSFYLGVWSMDPNEQSGSYYPANSQLGQFSFDPQEVFQVLKQCKTGRREKIPVYPSQKSVNWACEGEVQKQETPRKSNDTRPSRSSMDETRLSAGEYHSFGSESDPASDNTHGFPGFVAERKSDGQYRYYTSSESSTPKQFRSHNIIIQSPKKQGFTISKGHKNYELMLNLQLGIRHSVGRPSSATALDLRPTAFDTKEKIWTKFPPGGSKQTPPHQSCDFRWKDYCPLVFRTLRKLFNVDSADYMLSICGDDALRELSSPGKSGSFFYLTNDDKYMIKTMKKGEAKVLLRMLPAYYNHVRANENTLITKFYGLHCVKMTGQGRQGLKKVRFVIIGNLFCSDSVIHRRFDLKGSSHGRLTEKPVSEIDSTTTLKDRDLNLIFRLPKDLFIEFCRQLNKDCDFLEQERIMDYSLLVGVHFRELSQTGEPVASEAHGTIDSRSDIDPNRNASMRLGVDIPARAELTLRRDGCESQLVGEPTGEYYDVILNFGIIDVLQDYDITKKLEHAYKAFQYDATSISSVDPSQYSGRFRDFISNVFID